MDISSETPPETLVEGRSLTCCDKGAAPRACEEIVGLPQLTAPVSLRVPTIFCEEAVETHSRWFTFQGVRYHFMQWSQSVAFHRANQPAGVEQPDGIDQPHQFDRLVQVNQLHRANQPHRVEQPDEASPLILLHGFSQSAESWDAVARLLAQKHTVYALDLVGHGKSECPQSVRPYALDAQGEALLAFLKFVQQDSSTLAASASEQSFEQGISNAASRKPTVVGYSMGGRVALAAARQNPQAFSRLMLESVGIGPATNEERQAAAERDSACAARLREQGVEGFMDFWEQLPLFATQHNLPSEVQQRLRAQRLNNNAEALARSFEQAGQHTMLSRKDVFSTLADLRRNHIPVNYLVGELDKKYRTFSEILAEENLARTHVIGGAGHNVHAEKPRVFVQTIHFLP